MRLPSKPVLTANIIVHRHVSLPAIITPLQSESSHSFTERFLLLHLHQTCFNFSLLEHHKRDYGTHIFWPKMLLECRDGVDDIDEPTNKIDAAQLSLYENKTVK